MKDERRNWFGREVPAGLEYKNSSFSQLPVIDFAPMFSDSLDDRLGVAARLREACINVGFFYLKNHGVPQDLIDRAMSKAGDFFASPLDEKMAIAKANTPGYAGYSPMLELGGGHPDFKIFVEGFNINLDLPADDPLTAPEKAFYCPNQWPERQPEFKAVMQELWIGVEKGPR